MAFKKGRETTKSIGSRRVRKSHRRQPIRPQNQQSSQPQLTSTLRFDITNVHEDNRDRLSETIAQRRFVDNTRFQPVGETMLWLFVEVDLSPVPKQKHVSTLRTLEDDIARDITHRIKHPERVTTIR